MTMSSTAPAALEPGGPAASAELAADRKPGYYVNFNLFAVGIIAMAVMFAAYRVYQQIFAWNFGLDATTPEFDKYWMTLVKIEIPVLFGAGFLCWGYLWFTRDRNLAALTPKEELRRYFSFTLWLVAYTVAIYFIGSFFAEGDGRM
jgi:methane/ammonia monooxygenase subunit C